MEAFSAEGFVAILALVGVVILIAALFSGVIERSNVPQVAVFLALGAILGPAGLGLLDIHLDSPALRVVATLSLTLVLFTDAVTLNLGEVRSQAALALRVLGPGTILSAALVAVLAWWLLGLPPAAAAVLGAALASTDPVLLRGLLRRPELPGTVRQALRLEGGLNDIVVLPIVLVAMSFLAPGGAGQGPDWGHLFLNLFLLGPGAGVGVGLLAVATIDLIRRRVGVRRDYESLYSLGVAFAAYAAAESVHGSGFLAAFAAGLTISALDVELCDCFLEYGETTAELLLLFTFVLFGSSLIWTGFSILSGVTLLFAVLVLLARPVAFLLSLWRTNLNRRGRGLIAWFGPRGLSTLLVILLPVFAGLPGSEYLFAVCCLVVLLSITLHGGSLMLIGRRRPPQRGHPAPTAPLAEASAPAAASLPETNGRPSEPPGVPVAPAAPVSAEAHETSPAPAVAVVAPAAPATHPNGTEAAPERAAVPLLDAAQAGTLRRAATPERITIAEMRRLQAEGAPVLILDARSERTFESSPLLAGGAIRLNPDWAVREATALKLPRDAWLIAFCA